MMMVHLTIRICTIGCIPVSIRSYIERTRVTDYETNVITEDMAPLSLTRDVRYATKDSGEREVYDSGMQRDVTTGKTKWHLVTKGPMLKRWAELMTRGAEKYDDNNWMKADSEEEYDRFKQSAMRHFMQWYMGDSDEDHAAAVIFNINGTEYMNDKLSMQAWEEFRQANHAEG